MTHIEQHYMRIEDEPQYPEWYLAKVRRCNAIPDFAKSCVSKRLQKKRATSRWYSAQYEQGYKLKCMVLFLDDKEFNLNSLNACTIAGTPASVVRPTIRQTNTIATPITDHCKIERPHNVKGVDSLLNAVFGRNLCRKTNYNSVETTVRKVHDIGMDSYETPHKTKNGDKYTVKRFTVSPITYLPDWYKTIIQRDQLDFDPPRLFVTSKIPMGIAVSPVLVLITVQILSAMQADDAYNSAKEAEKIKAEKAALQKERKERKHQQELVKARYALCLPIILRDADIIKSQRRREHQKKTAELYVNWLAEKKAIQEGTMQTADRHIAPRQTPPRETIQYEAMDTVLPNKPDGAHEHDFALSGLTMPTSPRGLARMRKRMGLA